MPTSIIEVDNDLYIACSSIGATTNEDITLIKLDASNGTETWLNDTTRMVMKTCLLE